MLLIAAMYLIAYAMFMFLFERSPATPQKSVMCCNLAPQLPALFRSDCIWGGEEKAILSVYGPTNDDLGH